jgi:hypothetical protein
MQHNAALLAVQQVIVPVWQVQRQAKLYGQRMLDSLRMWRVHHGQLLQLHLHLQERPNRATIISPCPNEASFPLRLGSLAVPRVPSAGLLYSTLSALKNKAAVRRLLRRLALASAPKKENHQQISGTQGFGTG